MEQMNEIFAGLVIGIFLLVMGLATYLTRWWKWSKAARRLDCKTCGMGFRGRPGIRGQYRGVQIHVTTVWRWRTEQMQYKAEFPFASPPGLKMIHDDDCPSVGEIQDERRHQLRLPKLDNEFSIGTLQPEAANEFFRRPGAVDTLVDLQQRHGRLRIEDGALFIERRKFDSPDVIVGTVDALLDALEALAPQLQTGSQTW